MSSSWMAFRFWAGSLFWVREAKALVPWIWARVWDPQEVLGIFGTDQSLDYLGRPWLWSPYTDMAFWKMAAFWALLTACPVELLGLIFSGHIHVLRDTPYGYGYFYALSIINRHKNGHVHDKWTFKSAHDSIHCSVAASSV